LPGSTDLLLLWLVAHNGNPWLLTACAVSGSIVGGYTTWHVGRKGGDAALHRYVPARVLQRIIGWTKNNSILAVFLPALLPPPIPLTPFLLASGALGVSRGRFLPVYSAARTLRYSLVAWLGVAYGRHAIHLWSATLSKWSTPLICTFVGLLVAGLCYGIWKLRELGKTDAAKKPAMRTSAARAN
jgi:membrane protein YqaA with SNARE-associated domain